MYSYLKGKIVERGMKQTIIADALGISPKSLGLKLAGKRDFKWNEVCLIQSRFFPDIDKDTLFMAAEEKTKKEFDKVLQEKTEAFLKENGLE